MTRNSRELSQFASFVEVRDANKNIGLTTSLVMLGGVGIGSTVGDYLTERTSRGSNADDSLINFNETYLLDDVYIEGDLNLDSGGSVISGAGATFPNLNVSGVLTTSDLIVYDGAYFGDIDGVNPGLGTLQVNLLRSDPLPPGVAGTEFALFTPLEDNLVLFTGRVHFARPQGIQTFYMDRDYDIFFEPNTIFKDSIQVGYGGSDDGDERIITNNVGLVSAYRLILGPESPSDLIPGLGEVGYPQLTINAVERRGILASDTQPGFTTTSALEVIGGLNVSATANVGSGFSVANEITIGSSYLRAEDGRPSVSKIYTDLVFAGRSFSIGLVTDGAPGVNTGGKNDLILDCDIIGDVVPDITDYPANGIGTESQPWGRGYFDFFVVNDQAEIENLSVGSGATVSFLDVSGDGSTTPSDIILTVGPGISTFKGIRGQGDFNYDGTFFVSGLTTFTNPGGALIDGYITTSFQANNVDLTKQDETNSTNPEFFYPAMANSGQSQTTSGGALFVNPGFYLDAFGTSLFVHNNLNVLGTAINADESAIDLRFDLLNYGVKDLNIASQARYIDIGEAESSDGGITSIRSEVTELVRLRLKQNDIQASTGDTAITLTDNTLVAIAGNVAIGGTYIEAQQTQFNIAEGPLYGELFKLATDVLIGGNDIGIATIRNNVTELTGFLRLKKNAIQADDGGTAIEIGTGGTFTSTTGDLIVGGNDIQTGYGVTNIEMVGDSKTIFYGDIEIRGNEILSSDGAVNILMFDNQELTSFTGDIRVEGNQILAGTGDTNITMVANNNTIFAGPIQVNGDTIRASNGQDNITMDSDLLTAVAGDLRVGTGTMRAGDGTIAIAMEGGTGSVAITSDVTANSAFFNGLEARLNVQDVNIRDNLLTIGLIEDPTNEGTLIPPNVAAGNTGDTGILMARYDVGLSTHKYAGIFYDQSAGRVAIRTDVEPNPGTGEVGRDRYVLPQGLPSEMELQNLYININNTLGLTTIFEAGTVDTGEEVKEVLNVVNVEIDGGTF